MFVLHLKDLEGNPFEMKLKWSTWAMNRFCQLASYQKDDKGRDIPLTISEMFTILGSGNFSFERVCQFIQASAECADRGPVPYTEFDYADWIDQHGGLFKSTGEIADFARYIINQITNDVTPLPGEGELEKKNNP